MACAKSRSCLHWLCTMDKVLVEIGHHRCYSLHTQSSKARTGLRLCSISTMPILVVYKGYSGHVRQYMCYFFTYTIIGVLVGSAHVLNPDHAFTGCVQRISYRSRWASRVLFITNTIIEGLVGPVLCTISISFHWLCTKGYCIGQVWHHRCYSLHIQSLRVRSGLACAQS